MQFTITTPIDAPADTVWELLGRRFAAIAEWSDIVRSSRPIEMREVPDGVDVAPRAPIPGRSTTTKVTLTEVLTEFDDDARALTFVGVGLPPVLRGVSDRQTVTARDGGGSEVTFEVTVEFLGPFAVFGPVLRRRMRSTFGKVQDELKRAAESAASRP